MAKRTILAAACVATALLLIVVPALHWNAASPPAGGHLGGDAAAISVSHDHEGDAGASNAAAHGTARGLLAADSHQNGGTAPAEVRGRIMDTLTSSLGQLAQTLDRLRAGMVRSRLLSQTDAAEWDRTVAGGASEERDGGAPAPAAGNTLQEPGHTYPAVLPKAKLWPRIVNFAYDCLQADFRRIPSPVAVSKCSKKNTTRQDFVAHKSGDGYVISDVTRTRCLTDDGQSHLSLTDCDGSQRQLWIHDLVKDDSGPAGSPFRNSKTSKCLDRIEEQGQNGMVTLASTRRCDGSCDQRWSIQSPVTGSQMTAVPQRYDFSAQLGVKHVRVLCWIQTQPSAHPTKALAVNNTWGRDCDYLLFASTEDYPGLMMIVTESGRAESRRTLWVKTIQAWMYVYENYIDKAEWFFKADDDAYANMHYMRQFLANKDPAVPVSYGRVLYIGGKFHPKYQFLSGGCGQLLSKGAVQALGDAALSNPMVWGMSMEAPSDAMTSHSLWRAGVPVGSSLDEQGRNQFIVIGLGEEHRLNRTLYEMHSRAKGLTGTFWLFTYSNDTIQGPGCCSDRWLATHYVTPGKMYHIYNTLHLNCPRVPNKYPFLSESL